MELLSPSGDLNSFYAAIYNGANAVYLGLQNFNARIKADNFTVDTIGEVVKFAHLHQVKVYVTINILIKDHEVNDFFNVVRACVRAKVDAYIVQDLGMARLLLDCFPGIVLHASTQMGVHNLSGAKFLADFGFRRVVLSRETKLDDIKLIRENTNLEIEYFIQGALCVAFSGNCYLSSLKNGNSGNRGKCLQLCRLPYKVFDGSKLVTEGYYLSAKDLCLMNSLQTLKTAGVDCLKIEGRLKRAAYVAQVTRSYRQALDDFKSVDLEKEQAQISALFSRGKFNEQAYLYDNFNKINPLIGHHQGRKIGKVLATVPFKQIYKITLQLTELVGQNDAIRFVDKNRQYSVGVGNVNVLKNGNYEIFSKQKIPVGCDVYLLKNAAQENLLTEYVKRLPVDFSFTAHVGKPAKLTANCGTATVTVNSPESVEQAKTAGATYEQVYKQLSKLNDTKFCLNHLRCDLANVFLPVSELNELRRNVIVQLEDAMIAQYNQSLPKIEERRAPNLQTSDFPKKDFYMIAEPKDLNYVNLNGFSVIICPSQYNLDSLTQFVAVLMDKGFNRKMLYLNLPVVSTQAEVEMIDTILQKLQIGIVANNYAHFRWVHQFPTIVGMGLNVYNQYTANTLLQLGCENLIWSIEEQTTARCGSVLVSGYPTLMTLCHCPVREVYGSDCSKCRYHQNLVYQDERNNRYHFRRFKIQHCYFELYSEEKYQRVTNAGKIYDLRGS